MQDKLAWFYNEFIDKGKYTNWTQLYDSDIRPKLKSTFAGYSELYSFRNDIAHGVVNKSAKSLPNAKMLRQQAKDIVKKLYDILNEKEIKIPRLVTYKDANEWLISNAGSGQVDKTN